MGNSIFNLHTGLPRHLLQFLLLFDFLYTLIQRRNPMLPFGLAPRPYNMRCDHRVGSTIENITAGGTLGVHCFGEHLKAVRLGIVVERLNCGGGEINGAFVLKSIFILYLREDEDIVEQEIGSRLNRRCIRCVHLEKVAAEEEAAIRSHQGYRHTDKLVLDFENFGMVLSVLNSFHHLVRDQVDLLHASHKTMIIWMQRCGVFEQSLQELLILRNPVQGRLKQLHKSVTL